MSKATSPSIMGDYWLDKRRDGKSPHIWQIAFVKADTNSITYTSTRTRDIETAKKALETFFVTSRQGVPSIRLAKPPNPMAVQVIPHLYRYWEQHGQTKISADSIVRHLREFKAFLEQDHLGPKATFDDMSKPLFERYRSWLMGRRTYVVEWYGEIFHSRSNGVCGATYRRSFASVKAALNLAYEDKIVPHLWRFPSFPSELKSPPRTRVLTMEEVGAMIGYAKGMQDVALLHWIWIMLATGVRPVAGLQLIPSRQWDREVARLDLHPPGRRRTKKRNPRVPVIPQLLALMSNHEGRWIPSTVCHQTLSRRWRLMREALGFTEEVVPKTFRHTIATRLANARVPDLNVAMLLGHVETASWRVQEVLSPTHSEALIPTLSSMWDEAHSWAHAWSQKYVVASTRRGAKLVLPRNKLSTIDLDENDVSVLDSLSGRQLREARSAPCSYTGHGCMANYQAEKQSENRICNPISKKPKAPASLTSLPYMISNTEISSEADILSFIASDLRY